MADHDATTEDAQPGKSVWPIEDIDEWRRVLYDESSLFSGPVLSDEMLRREHLHDDHD